jgi:hypothetical protein
MKRTGFPIAGIVAMTFPKLSDWSFGKLRDLSE